MIDVNALTFDGDGTPEKQVLRTAKAPRAKVCGSVGLMIGKP
jgi:hypothetical protein